MTTAPELEAGPLPVARAYARAAGEGRPLNDGFSASWGAARAEVLCGRHPDADFVGGLEIVAEVDPTTPVDGSAEGGRIAAEVAGRCTTAT